MAQARALSEIDAAVAAATAERRRTWFDRLPADAQATLMAARDKFRSGEYGPIKRLTLARVLIEHAAKCGWVTCDCKRMSEWIARRT